MKTAIFMLTDTFPFEVGEEFFEQELTHISSVCDQMFFVPVRLNGSPKLTRSIPDNAVTIVPQSPNTTNKWLVLAKYLVPLATTNRKFLRSSRKRSFKHLAMDFRFFSNALDVYSRIRSQLQQVDFKSFDSVVFYSYWFYTGVVIAELIKRDFTTDIRTKIISRAHAYDIDEDDTPNGFIPGRDFLLKTVDEVYPISNHAAKFITEVFPQYASKAHVKRLGVPAGNPKERTLDAPVHLLSISHMAGYKRVHLIADAVEVLEQRGYKISWTHIGEFNKERFDEMQAYVNAKKLTSEVILTGHMSNPEVQKYLRECNAQIFVNSSSGEGVPVTIMEALANGIPVVATQAGGSAEIVHHNLNGKTLPVACTGADIATEIAEIIDTGLETYQAYCIESVKMWETYADATKQYQQMALDLQRLLKG